MSNIKIKFNQDLKTPFGLFAKNQEIEIDAKDGVALQHFWRNRIRDAEIDNAIKIISNEIDNPSEIISNEIDNPSEIINNKKNKK